MGKKKGREVAAARKVKQKVPHAATSVALAPELLAEWGCACGALLTWRVRVRRLRAAAADRAARLRPGGRSGVGGDAGGPLVLAGSAKKPSAKARARGTRACALRRRGR